MSSLTMFYRSVLIFSSYFFCMCFVSPSIQTIYTHTPTHSHDSDCYNHGPEYGPLSQSELEEWGLLWRVASLKASLPPITGSLSRLMTHSVVSSVLPSPDSLFQTKCFWKWVTYSTNSINSQTEWDMCGSWIYWILLGNKVKELNVPQ